MVIEDYRERNVWFLEMGARKSKIKSPPKTPTRTNCGNGNEAITSHHSVPMKPLRPTNPEPVPVWPDNSVRWQRMYDVYICHSEEEADCSYAMQMLSYLEQQPEKLRCFLPMRDMLGGNPITSEMCSGLESSHCWVMLLTPHFLSDQWCKYQMHQFLAHAPCSNGRLIPVIIGLSFDQYPVEVKHMYAFKAASNDTSVFINVKGAIVTYLKEMLTVTCDQIPTHSPRSPEGSQYSSKSEGNSQVEMSMTQESTSDKFSRRSVAEDVTSDTSMRSSVTEESPTDRFSRTPMTQTTTRNISSRTVVIQEITTDMSSRTPVIQETTTDKSLIAVTQMTSDRSLRIPATLETTSERSLRSPVTHEITSIKSPRSPLTQETSSDVSLLVSEAPTRDMLTRSFDTRQENTTDMSMKSSATKEEIASDFSLGSLASEEITGDIWMGNSVTDQETTSDKSMRNSVTGLETPCWLQNKYKDLSLSPSLTNNSDVCIDSNCIMAVAKDSFSRETRLDTSDSGVWSMTKDLHTDCSDLYRPDVQTARNYSHCNDLYTSGVQTARKHSHSECRDLYISGVQTARKHSDSECRDLYISGVQTARKHSDSECRDLYISGVQTTRKHSDSECSDFYSSGLDHTT
ncbi:toll/interleukin-1 receptor domain-containing adapter protein [Leptodactylus fuscus]|uniref:toll/interleukin-1 receptor domain-containing adapter protein n=1 Tax=Leptodactylus fuscus TaxID=238119 RepID=UPI003F4E4E93